MVTSDSLSDSTKYKVPSLPFYDISLSISLTKAPLSNISLVDTGYFFSSISISALIQNKNSYKLSSIVHVYSD